VREELSIEPEIRAQPLVIDWAPADGEGDKILFIFGGTVTGAQLDAITFADGELAEARFIDPAALGTYTVARLTRRIHTALNAMAAGRTLYPEHGEEAKPPLPRASL